MWIIALFMLWLILIIFITLIWLLKTINSIWHKKWEVFGGLGVIADEEEFVVKEDELNVVDDGEVVEEWCDVCILVQAVWLWYHNRKERDNDWKLKILFYSIIVFWIHECIYRHYMLWIIKTLMVWACYLGLVEWISLCVLLSRDIH